MKERHQRRPFAAPADVLGPEVPDNGTAGCRGQPEAVARLMRAAPARIVRQRLAVKTDQLGLGEVGRKIRVTSLDQPGDLGHEGGVGPTAQGVVQDG